MPDCQDGAAPTGRANTAAGASNDSDPKGDRLGDAPLAASASATDIATLVVEHHVSVYRYAYRLTGAAADAEDLTQQTFLVAHQKIMQLRATENARQWLYTILRNSYLKGFRRRTPISATSLALDIESIAEKTPQSPVDQERLQAALNELPERFKLVVMLFYFEERPYREIAELLEVPLGTVMSRLSRAKAHLRQRLFDSDGSGRPDQRKGMEPDSAARERPAAMRR